MSDAKKIKIYEEVLELIIDQWGYIGSREMAKEASRALEEAKSE